MRSFVIKDKKTFTQKLFADNAFDQFLMCEASFMTSQTYTIDGRILTDYYDSADEKPTSKYTSWGPNRAVCYQIIKGKRLPLFFKIVLCMSDSAIVKIIERSGCNDRPEDIEGLYLNIHFRDNTLFCTTGISQKTFSFDKTLSNYWDAQIEGFLKKNEIEYDQSL